MAARKKSKPTRRKRRVWARYTDDRLLDLRICDLELALDRTPLQGRVKEVYAELEYRGIGFRPHFWLSEEWFSPDGVPGVAIPFYLAHPRLVTLERRQMLEVEGGTRDGCMRILRHEVGHTLDTAYRLHRRRRWREVFGSASKPYPEYYQPKPYSKSFVVHLESWYGQSHPCEDFAETFAVWLKPRSRWRSRYAGWPAMKKLLYVDELMKEIAEQKPLVRSREKVDPTHAIRKTLRQHYEDKQARYAITDDASYTHILGKLFAYESQDNSKPRAASFLRKSRKELRRLVAQGTGQYVYTIDQVLSDMIDHCREQELRLTQPEEETFKAALVLLTAQTLNYLQTGRTGVTM
jgi:hypothetical protein